MKDLNIHNINDKEFLQYRLPNLLKKLMLEEIQSPKSKSLLAYINNNYNVTESDIVNALIQNFVIITDVTAKKTTIRINPNAYISTQGNKRVKLLTILHLLNYGNLDIHGNAFYNKIISRVQLRINKLYKMYRIQKLQKGSCLWE